MTNPKFERANITKLHSDNPVMDALAGKVEMLEKANKDLLDQLNQSEADLGKTIVENEHLTERLSQYVDEQQARLLLESNGAD